MNRPHTLPGGCKNLNDVVRVIGLDGEQLPLMTIAEAQTLAAQKRADLVHIATGKEPILRLVDDAVRSQLRRGA